MNDEMMKRNASSPVGLAAVRGEMLCGLDRSAREVRVAALKTDGCLGMALTQGQQHMAARMLWAGEVVARQSERRQRGLRTCSAPSPVTQAAGKVW